MSLFDVFKVNQYKAEIEQLRRDNESLNARINALGIPEYESVKAATDELQRKYDGMQRQSAGAAKGAD